MERDKPINISDQWPILLTWFTLIRPWISDYIHYKEWVEITYSFLNFNGANITSHFTGFVIIYSCSDES